MTVADRIAAFEKLGNYLLAIDEVEFDNIAIAARNENSWFTRESIKQSLDGIQHFLKRDTLNKWLSGYYLMPSDPKTVAVVMAGNIPLVGFHDLLCVLISGHKIQLKLSSKDTRLMQWIIKKLTDVEPRFTDFISVTERLKDFDAVIATGSDNSARYFDYYFGKYPHIIRKNRTSCAIITGFESTDELHELGKDVFSYFGLGCRNVSKIYVPVGYNFSTLLDAWKDYESVLMHHKYHNNYDYQKSILLVNRIPHLDSGFIMLRESDQLVSPISVLFYEFYENWENLLKTIDTDKEKIQCIVGNVSHATVKIGQAQSPGPDDYADQVDTLKFLEGLG